jgi:hypothetical protein
MLAELAEDIDIIFLPYGASLELIPFVLGSNEGLGGSGVDSLYPALPHLFSTLAFHFGSSSPFVTF